MKTLPKILLASTLLLSVTGIEAQTVIGYTNGNVERKHGVRFGVGETQGMAIKISKEKSQLLKGSKILSIESVFSTKRTQNLKFFISKDLGQEPLYQQAAEGSNTRWTKYALNAPYVIDGDEFYVGYTCDASTDYAPLLFDESQDYDNGLVWAWNDGKWMDVSQKGYGAGNLRFVIDGDKSINDLVIKPVDVSGYYKVGKGEQFSGQLYNFGNSVVNSFDLSCQMGTGEPVTYHVENANLQPNSTYDFELPEYIPSAKGKVPFKVSATAVNGATDADTKDNITTSETYIYPESTEKKILIEGFTGQLCGNCPEGHNRLAAAIRGIEDNFIEVSHHAGYQPDIFTMKEDLDYTWFYNNNGSTFAPAVTFNRTALSEGESSVVFMMQDTQALNHAIQQNLTEQPYVSIDLNNKYDETTRKSELTVRVYTHVLPKGKDHRLNLFLTQNNIKASQSGAGGNYAHNHVFRGALNGTWGEQIELIEGQTVEKKFEYILPENIESTQNHVKVKTVAADMNYVAFVSAASNSPLSCNVFNAASIKLTDDIVSGIEETEHFSVPEICVNGNVLQLEGAVAAATVYNLSGRAVSNLGATKSVHLSAGVYLVRIKTLDGKMIAQKISISR